MMIKGSRIIIVEDDDDVAEFMASMLSKNGYEVSGVYSTGEQAIEEVSQCKPDLVLMDMVLAGELDGLETARKILKRIKIPIIYLTGYSDMVEILQNEGKVPLLKPFSFNDLQAAIEVSLFKANLK
jgi:DNA-binding response OmpR family regulator